MVSQARRAQVRAEVRAETSIRGKDGEKLVGYSADCGVAGRTPSHHRVRDTKTHPGHCRNTGISCQDNTETTLGQHRDKTGTQRRRRSDVRTLPNRVLGNKVLEGEKET